MSKNKDESLLEDMEEVRAICKLGHKARQKAGIPLRQPLAEMYISNINLLKSKDSKELLQIVAEELNIKKVSFQLENKVLTFVAKDFFTNVKKPYFEIKKTI